jgi:hypothetical protein
MAARMSTAMGARDTISSIDQKLDIVLGHVQASLLAFLRAFLHVCISAFP